ncbi:MAG: hypothetical protein NZ740_03215 [Kiritimatiellae bacterium]|nr:hypothetical protein [Kiritimatiellia bacterium]MDW8458102.1 hypothetical protein [Verrucomicrobiota bacterium]
MFCAEEIPALEPIRRMLLLNRSAMSILIVGSPEGRGLSLAETIAKISLCPAEQPACETCPTCAAVARREHPDLLWLEPARKTRIISVDQIRELIQFTVRAPYSGSRKVGVILSADRMNPEAMNALLKTLEEPPGDTVLLLVTDQPQSLLPTIVSRCFRVNLGEPETPPIASWRSALEEWLAETGPRGSITALARAGRLQKLIESIEQNLDEETGEEGGDHSSQTGELDRERTEDERESVSREVREARLAAKLAKERDGILKTIQLWQRDILAVKLGAPAESLHFPNRADVLGRQAQAVSVAELQQRIRAVDEARMRLNSNLRPLIVFDAMVRTGI